MVENAPKFRAQELDLRGKSATFFAHDRDEDTTS
jgi:hypothetical protein